MIENPDLSIEDGGMYIPGAMARHGYSWEIFRAMAKAAKIDLTKPVKDLTKKELDIIFYGYDEKFKFDYTGGEFDFHGYKEYEGAVKNLERRYYESFSEAQKEEIENRYMVERICKVCKGKRLKDEVLAVTVNDKNIMEICDMSIKNSLDFFMSLSLTEKQEKIAKEILKEIRERLTFMTNVGLDYLTLSRETKTLSGGESQRIRLATQIGSQLMGVLYILDEPSIGLHQRDNDRLIATLKKLRDVGNTLIVVEHDEDTIREADYIVDIGPGAGEHGGEVTFAGTYDEILKDKNSLTGRYLTGQEKIEVPKERRKGNGNFITIKGARENNLKNVNVKVPLGTLTMITGVSGSGKSTLTNEILYKGLNKIINKSKYIPGNHKEILGYENIDKIIDIDQSPIGRTPRSNPATYTGTFDIIREADLPKDLSDNFYLMFMCHVRFVREKDTTEKH